LASVAAEEADLGMGSLLVEEFFTLVGGISRPTLRKWVVRYKDSGESGLKSLSRRPHRSPNRKVTEEDRNEMLRLRREGKGARRIKSHLRLNRNKDFSLATIHKVLITAKVAPLVKP
jgi:transposase